MLRFDTYYHGSPKRIERFMDDFVGGKEANDQEGPGIYFTSDINNARRYGEFVHTVELTPRAVMTKDHVDIRRSVSRNLLVKLAKAAPDWKRTAQNWDENPQRGLIACIDSIFDMNESVAEVFQQLWVEFYRHASVDYVRNVVRMTKYDAIVADVQAIDNNDIQHVIVYNPMIIKMKQDTQELDEVRKLVRGIIKEASAMDMAMHKQPTVAPAMAAGRTVDQEGLVAFLRQQGLFGNEDDILSILEGRPSEKVTNDVSEYMSFNNMGTDPSQLGADTMLDYYLQWNHLNLDKNQVLAFSINER